MALLKTHDGGMGFRGPKAAPGVFINSFLEFARDGEVVSTSDRPRLNGVRITRMDFSEQPSTSATHVASLCAVALLHLAGIYLFVSGTWHRVVHVMSPSIETRVIVEAKPVPPPTQAPPPRLDTPRLAPVQLPYIPMPEIQIQRPLPPPPTAISAITSVKPETSAPPAVPTHVAPEVPAASSAPPAPAPVATATIPRPAPVIKPPVIDAARNCKKPAYPPASVRLGEAGTVLLRFLIDADGKVKSSEVQASSGHQRLDEAAREGLSLCRFKPGLSDGKPVEAWATLRYTWVLQE
jgi:periplasmic protein TonB